MAKFEDAVKYLRRYLEAKPVFLSGKKPGLWFTSGIESYGKLLDKFNAGEEDAQARQIYDDLKNPDKKVPLDKERKYRLRTMFMAALLSTVRKQYLCGPDSTPRTSLDSYRYEMANTQAVRCCLNKMDRVQEAMGVEEE